MRTVGKYLGVWVAIALSVGLVSFTFTFLGTITSAVLIGMMLGALKGPKGFSALVSLVFPAVIFGMTRSTQSELTPRQVLLLGALCFGAFWVTHAVSALMFFCEQKDRKVCRVAAPAFPPGPLAPGGPDAAGGSAAAAAPPPLHPAAEGCLEQLQGSWVCETATAGQPPGKRVLQIKQASLELQSVDVRGHMTLIARGKVTLQSAQAS